MRSHQNEQHERSESNLPTSVRFGCRYNTRPSSTDKRTPFAIFSAMGRSDELQVLRLPTSAGRRWTQSTLEPASCTDDSHADMDKPASSCFSRCGCHLRIIKNSLYSEKARINNQFPKLFNDENCRCHTHNHQPISTIESLCQ